MSIFNSFVDKAKNKLDEIQNPKEQINGRRFKDPNAKYNQKDSIDDFKPYLTNKNSKNNPRRKEDQYLDPFSDDFYDNREFGNDPVSLYPAQKPESFHFFILENQYQDLERAIRGVKDVWDKEN